MKTILIILNLVIILCITGTRQVTAQMTDMGKGHNSMKSGTMSEQKIEPRITVPDSPMAKAVLDAYLSLKNALVADNGRGAAVSGKALLNALSKIDPSQVKSRQKDLADILSDAKENAEHISKSVNDIDHQREHFSILGDDIKDLIAIIGSDRTLYQMFCPMFNDKEGAIWFSDSKEITNPYYGSKMPKCGSVQQEISLK
jgi:hypothetical protein